MNETFSILITVLIISFVVYLIIRKWLSEWEGELVDKKIARETDEDGYSTKKKRLVFKTSEGKTQFHDVGKREYKNAEIGQIYIKRKYTFKPKRKNA